MRLIDELMVLVEELNRIHSSAISWHEEFPMPDFVTAANGMQRHFTPKAQNALISLAKILHANRPHEASKIELKNYGRIVKQVVADMHAEREFDAFSVTNNKNVTKKLKTLIEERIACIAQEYTHFFPAWTLGIERTAAFNLGPVSFLTRNDWIDSVDFSLRGKDSYLGLREANHLWKEILKEALQNPMDRTQLEGIAEVVYDTIEHCPSLLKVTIRGYEKDFSHKLAKLVCKTALDAVSLGFGGAPEYFYQQALYEERLPPVGSYSLVESNGFLWLPGSVLSNRIPYLSATQIGQALANNEIILSAFSSILMGLVNPEEHKHPKLANRWATALDWFGEGNRESSDAIAVAKFGTCLDVLACGGKNEGIAQMVINLTGIDGDKIVIDGATLKELVKDIYDDGRSKILHGTYFDRLKSFADERQRAAKLAVMVLINSAVRLHQYSGSDEDKAFRTMSAAQS